MAKKTKKNSYVPILIVALLVVVIGVVLYVVKQHAPIKKLEETDPAYIEAYGPWVTVTIGNVQLDLPKKNAIYSLDEYNYFRDFTERYGISFNFIPLATLVNIQSPIADAEQQKYANNIPSKLGPWYLVGAFGLYEIQNQTIAGFISEIEQSRGTEQSCKARGSDMSYTKGTINKLTADSTYYLPSECTPNVGGVPWYLTQRGVNVYVFPTSQAPPPRSVMLKIISSLKVK
jgi:hypothetical protein